jgi:hypothetical protein
VAVGGAGSDEGFGALLVQVGPVTIAVGAISSAEALGTPTASNLALLISPGPIASAEAFGAVLLVILGGVLVVRERSGALSRPSSRSGGSVLVGAARGGSLRTDTPGGLP